MLFNIVCYIVYNIVYNIACTVIIPNGQQISWIVFLMTGYAIMLKTAASKLFFFWTVLHDLCSCTCSLDTCQRTLINAQFTLVHGQCYSWPVSLTPWEPILFTILSNRGLHRRWTLHSSWCLRHCTGRISYSNTLYNRIKTPYNTQNGTARLSLVRGSAQLIGPEAIKFARDHSHFLCKKLQCFSHVGTVYTA